MASLTGLLAPAAKMGNNRRKRTSQVLLSLDRIVHRPPSGVARPRAPQSRHSQDPRSLLQDLELLVTLAKLASHGIERKGGGGAGKMYAVEYEGQIIEMDESEYRSYLRRRQEHRAKEVQGHQPDIAGQSRLTSANKVVPAPPREDED